jgi:hypothetical protein
VGAHRIIAVQADGHAEIARERLSLGQLLVSEPLKIQMEIDARRRSARELRRRGPLRILELRGPAEPARGGALRRAEVLVQRVEARMQLERRPAGGHEARERRRALGAERQMPAAKFAEQELEDFELDAGHAPIIDQRDIAQPLQSRRERGVADRALASALSRYSGTAGTEMYSTLRKWRLEAL